jgi:hypothetical protein
VSRLLLIGYGTEGTFAHFRDFVAASDTEHDVLDLASLREAHDLTITESPGELTVSIDDDVYRFADYDAFYGRAYWFELGAPARNRALSSLIGAMHGYLDRVDARVANRPSAGVSNVNKLVHLLEVGACGFAIPEAHILGDPARARALVTADGSWINKSCSSIKTRSAAVEPALWARLDRLAVCPSLFQRRVRGPDVRVHVVGDELFPEKIVSQQVDYRYRDPAFPRAEFSHDVVVPPEVARACREYCRRQRLLFAGIDFKISDADGIWYVLESNPMPGYEPYDRRQDRRISRALLALLGGGGAPDLDPFIVATRRPIPSPFT